MKCGHWSPTAAKSYNIWFDCSWTTVGNISSTQFPVLICLHQPSFTISCACDLRFYVKIQRTSSYLPSVILLLNFLSIHPPQGQSVSHTQDLNLNIGFSQFRSLVLCYLLRYQSISKMSVPCNFLTVLQPNPGSRANPACPPASRLLSTLNATNTGMFSLSFLFQHVVRYCEKLQT